ncbi:hypothetical protein CLV67_10879 [Actinoplanes italicus]|uniref:Uncharacterized protein n=1 Tax=Actinoplanes italicus TaxID=113567 RepID=A0A2T0KAR6_9ACTN|nr:hypothetical protein CLV67_10879 [Actinoplanes italicus]
MLGPPNPARSRRRAAVKRPASKSFQPRSSRYPVLSPRRGLPPGWSPPPTSRASPSRLVVTPTLLPARPPAASRARAAARRAAARRAAARRAAARRAMAASRTAGCPHPRRRKRTHPWRGSFRRPAFPAREPDLRLPAARRRRLPGTPSPAERPARADSALDLNHRTPYPRWAPADHRSDRPAPASPGWTFPPDRNRPELRRTALQLPEHSLGRVPSEPTNLDSARLPDQIRTKPKPRPQRGRPLIPAGKRRGPMAAGRSHGPDSPEPTETAGRRVRERRPDLAPTRQEPPEQTNRMNRAATIRGRPARPGPAPADPRRVRAAAGSRSRGTRTREARPATTRMPDLRRGRPAARETAAGSHPTAGVRPPGRTATRESAERRQRPNYSGMTEMQLPSRRLP